MSLLAEIRRRKVHRAAAFYAAGAWLLVQVAATVFPYFDLPAWSVRLLIVTLLIGFPVALVVSWFYTWTAHGWQLEDAPAAAARPMPAAEAKRPRDNSIAVLPFADLSEAKDQEYFSDGLAEELLNLLAQLPQLQVTARTSSFSFKGKDADIATIARALDVAHVLEGSVRKSGNRLRVTAQLIRAADSSHLWSQNYEREITDVFAMQDEIAGAVVAALKVRLLPDQHLTHASRTAVSTAYEQFLIGKDVQRHGRYDDHQRAAQAFQNAIALDPHYAAAWAGLAVTQSVASDYATSIDGRFAGRQAAFASAERAIVLAPELADGYVVRGQLRHRHNWDWLGGMRDLQRAFALEPNKSEHVFAVAFGLYCLGDPVKALEIAHAATVADPLSWPAWTIYGALYSRLDRRAEARAALERALEVSPQASIARVNLGDLDLREERPEAALEHFRKTGEGHRQAGVAKAEYSLGHEQASVQALAELEAKYAFGFAYQIAEVHAWRGEVDAAFAWLDRACERRDSGIPRIRGDEVIGKLQHDPRYAQLMARLNFPPTEAIP